MEFRYTPALIVLTSTFFMSGHLTRGFEGHLATETSEDA